MSPELITAIKERIIAGQTKEDIKTAVLAMGHEEVVCEAAYTLALSDLQKSATSVEPQPITQTLPTAYQLLEDALAFVFKRLDIVLFVLIPGLLFFALSYAGEHISEPKLLTQAIDAFSIVAFILYMIAIFSAMYMVSGEKPASYSDSLLWAKQHMLSLVWISILMALVILGGFLLFIIPGIILSLSLYFSQYAFILEGQKGAAALSRSRELVRGRFFAIALKLAAFSFYLLAPLFLVMIVMVIAATVYSPLMHYALLGQIGVEVVSAVVTVVGAHVMSRLYRALQVGRPLAAVTVVKKGVYGFLAVLGVVAFGLLVALAMFLDAAFNQSLLNDTAALKTEIQSLSVTAQLYASEHDGSFVGACEVLKGKITTADLVECNDSEQAWAVMGSVGEERWCADTDSIGKEAQSALGDRLTCLSLPEKTPLESAESTEPSQEIETATSSAQ